ncbi:MAG: type IV pilus assembly protein PilY1 [Halioglobus sp.]|jgi:type IV pilus assembly protein PilY1
MMSKFFTKAVFPPLVASLILAAYSGLAPADDTEIYQTTQDAASTARPKVLIVFDDSGSMGFNVENQKPEYSSSTTYTGGAHPAGRIYYSSDGTIPDEGSNEWFPVNKNYCAESLPGLNNRGFFASKSAFQWRLANEKWKWRNIQAARTDLVIDCWEDLQKPNNDNLGAASGYPRQGSLDDATPPPPPKYVTDLPPATNNIWKRPVVYNFYSANYMNWKYKTDLPLVTRTRIDIAQEVVTGIIFANRGLDFGLMEFNYGTGSANGGRVLQRIIENMTLSDRDNVITLVENMKKNGSTPMCESMYEAYLYLAGKPVEWGGLRNTTNAGGDEIPRDTAAESPAGTYDSPATDCAYTYVILMTDGFPQNDASANGLIESLSEKTCNSYDDANGNQSKNCLPELAEYMATNDLDGVSTNGNQFGITYTIGFATDQDLLRDAAEKGKGKYFTADSADELTAAFSGAIYNILASDSSFTSPAVAVDTFTRTRSRNDVFYAMFKPSEEINWIGNIKKLKLSMTATGAVLVDSLGAAAIDASTGDFKSSISTFWSSGDGGAVETGGVGALLAARGPGTRVIKSNTGTNGALESYDSVNMTRDAFGFSTDTALFDFFGVSTQAGLDAELAYGRGFEINDDGSISAVTREWILADILHSQPVVINYGSRSGFTKDNPDLRIIVGTNGGFLHMFGDNNGQEDWAFFPKELAPILRQRRLSPVSADHVYGIDALPLIYTKDNDQNGTIDSGDKVWAFFGLRRGGRSMYALDLSNPDNPAYLWGIDFNTTGFSEMGQTWSVPVVTRIPGYADTNGVPKPVIIFGAGYDVNKDDTGAATTDGMGRGLYIVDAATGGLVWSVTPASNSATNMQETGLQHSVAGQITAVDSNGDELTDRIYFASTGGNVWRVDMGVSTLPTNSQNTWRITQLADFNGGTDATDRRFFYAPDIVRIRKNGAPVDAVLIGSGDRTNPNATDVDNRFYVVNDEAIVAYTTAPPLSSECSATPPSTDFRCQLPLDDADLFDVTSNVLNTGTDSDKAIAVAALAAGNGLRLNLTQSGEKVSANSFTINGRAFFPTFTPDDGLNSINVCEPEAGQGLLYVFDIYKGDRQTINLGPRLTDSPSVHFGEDGKIRLLLPPGSPTDNDGDSGDVCVNGVCDIGEVFRAPYGNYWFQEEY